MSSRPLRFNRPSAPVQPAVGSGVRGFRLSIQSAPPVAGGGDRYGIRLEEAYSDGERTLTITSAVAARTPLQTSRILDALVAAVRASGHQAGVLSPARRAPIALDEPAGVRLALAMLACGPVRKASRIRQIVSGVAAMSTEETYYWYAKAVGPNGDRVHRALRLFLAEE